MSSVTTTSDASTTLSSMQRFLFIAVGVVLAFTGAYLLTETFFRFFGDVPHSAGVAIARIAFGVLALVFAFVCLTVVQTRGRPTSAEE